MVSAKMRCRRGLHSAELEAVLVPVYLHHRYQLQAAVKVIGGVDYSYALRGDGQRPIAFLDPAWQLRALNVILSILEPEALDFPEAVLEMIPPRPQGEGSTRELFRGRTDPVFDSLSAAATAAGMVVDGLLQPERAGRLVDFHRRDPAQPGLEVVLDALTEQVFETRRPSSLRLAEIQRVVQIVTVDGMIMLSADADAPFGVRARVDAQLTGILERLKPVAEADAIEAAHRMALTAQITAHRDRGVPPLAVPLSAPAVPPGDPIG